MHPMIIEFQKKRYILPDPEQRPLEKVIRVEKYASFPKPPSASRSRFRFSHALAKVFFFFLHEGPRLTRDKVKSSFLQRKSGKEKRVVMAYGRLQGEEGYALAVGPQSCPRSEYLVFPAPCAVEISKDGDLNRYCLSLQRFFEENPEALEALYHHSPYSGLDLDFELKEVLDRAQPDPEPGRAKERPRIHSLSFSNAPRQKEQRRRDADSAGLDLFLAGAGAYAYAYILPSIRNVRFHTVIDLNPALACAVAEKFGFAHRDTSTERGLKRLAECETPLLVVATYHSTHLEIVEQALGANPNTKIFVEKPPVTTRQQLDRLMELRKNSAFIEIGYNRRHSPMAGQAHDLVSARSGPIAMTCIVKELDIPVTHWYFWPTQGTRITGNLSHWLDLGTWFIREKPVFASIVSPPGTRPGDEATIVVLYEDGSRLTLMSTDKGNPLRGVQEYIDIRREDLTVQIHDFTKMFIQKGGRSRTRRSLIRDKGHLRMYRGFMQNIRQGAKPEYPDADLYTSSLLYILISEAAMQGKKEVQIGPV